MDEWSHTWKPDEALHKFTVSKSEDLCFWKQRKIRQLTGFEYLILLNARSVAQDVTWKADTWNCDNSKINLIAVTFFWKLHFLSNISFLSVVSSFCEKWPCLSKKVFENRSLRNCKDYAHESHSKFCHPIVLGTHPEEEWEVSWVSSSELLKPGISLENKCYIQALFFFPYLFLTSFSAYETKSNTIPISLHHTKASFSLLAKSSFSSWDMRTRLHACHQPGQLIRWHIFLSLCPKTHIDQSVFRDDVRCLSS